MPSKVSTTFNALTPQTQPEDNFGNPDTSPVVVMTSEGEVLVLMKVDGITCSHCVKIIETVLKGCDTKSPIPGLMDCVADEVLKLLLVRIDHATNAKRIAFESSRNLSMVGYTVTTVELNLKTQKNKSRRRYFDFRLRGGLHGPSHQTHRLEHSLSLHPPWGRKRHLPQAQPNQQQNLRCL